MSAALKRLWAAFSYNPILKGGHAIPTQPGYMPGFFHAITKEESISMADDKKIPGKSEQAPPVAPGKPETAVPAAETPRQVTPDRITPPAGTDKAKTDPTGKEVPAVGQKTDPKQKDGKVIDITGKAGAHTEPVKKPAAPENRLKLKIRARQNRPAKAPLLRLIRGRPARPGHMRTKCPKVKKAINRRRKPLAVALMRQRQSRKRKAPSPLRLLPKRKRL